MIWLGIALIPNGNNLMFASFTVILQRNDFNDEGHEEMRRSRKIGDHRGIAKFRQRHFYRFFLLLRDLRGFVVHFDCAVVVRAPLKMRFLHYSQ